MFSRKNRKPEDPRRAEWLWLNEKQVRMSEESGGEEQEYFVKRVENPVTRSDLEEYPTTAVPSTLATEQGAASPAAHAHLSVEGESDTVVGVEGTADQTASAQTQGTGLSNRTNAHDLSSTAIEQMPQAKSYKHTPLQPGGFRMLVLQPSAKSWADRTPKPLHGTLRETSLQSTETYSALSYVCGPDDASQVIMLDQAELKISARLHHILSKLRDEKEPRNLWIDAICIDQTDLDEKMRQIRSMGQIYATADIVISWLDMPSDLTSVVELNRCASVLRQESGCYMMGEDEHGRERVMARVYKHEYWRRRWIVQEVLQAERIEVHFEGSYLYKIPFTLFGRLVDNPDVSHNLGQPFHLRANVSMLKQLWSQRQTVGGEKSSLAKLIRAVDGTKCLRPHDKVFALLSLAGSDTSRYQSTYETPLLDVLLEVIELSCAEPEFVQSGVLSFASYLRTELGVSRQAIQEKIAQLRNISLGERKVLAVCSVIVRGSITGRLSNELEQTIVDERSRAHALSHYSEIPLHRNDHEIWHLSTDPAPSSEFEQPLRHVSVNDLKDRAWSNTSPEIRSTSQHYICFLSSRVRDGDEIWQFEDTDLAIIVRPPNNGEIKMVARAQLLKTRDTTDEDRGSPIDTMTKPPLRHDKIALDNLTLLILLLWTSFDNEDDSNFLKWKESLREMKLQ